MDEEIEYRLKVLSNLTTEAIARAIKIEVQLKLLQKEVKTIEATQPYLIKRIGELTKKCQKSQK